MASRTNKYAALNFNHVYEQKNVNPSNDRSHASSSPSFSSSFSAVAKTALSNSRIHGNMLVLTRPAPKPSTLLQSPPPSPLPLGPSFQDPIPPESDHISLRPLGRTGSCPSPVVVPPFIIHQKPDKDLTPPLPLSPSPKTNRFVPPHLRPGFVGREEKQQPEFQHKHQIGRARESGGQRQAGPPEMKRPSGSGRTRPTSSG